MIQPALQPIEWRVSTRTDAGEIERSAELYTLMDAWEIQRQRNAEGGVWWIMLEPQP